MDIAMEQVNFFTDRPNYVAKYNHVWRVRNLFCDDHMLF
ncbi:hypothetical protein RintRC_0412 [Richelia intracellularis]|nr:hypothetical protein RintRC_0412 [Richelia intracellularis]